MIVKNYHPYLKTAVEAAKAAGAIQKKGFGKNHSVRFKGEINLVTEIDKACEEKIVKIISKKFPRHDLLTEESGAFNRLSEFKWIIDPLDGTTNYAHSYPCFCASIGLEYQGQMLLGVVYEPMMDQLFVGVRGQGATLNRKKISVSKISSLNRALLSTGFAYNLRVEKNNNLDHFENFLMHAQAVRRDGAAAVDLCYVACGRFDGFWEIDLWPWDTSAAGLILEEAGGKVSLFDGSPYTIYDKEIVASNGMIHQEMVRILKMRQGVS